MLGVKKTTEEFVAEAQSVHGDKFDYSKTIYLTAKKHVTIICKTHGEFDQIASDHVRGRGCPTCADRTHDTKWFIAEATRIHGGKYTYEKSKYSGMIKQLIVTCPTHGDYSTMARTHLLGHGCKSCYHDESRITKKEFIIRSNKLHGDKYDYSKTEFSIATDKTIITCPIHGDFEQIAHQHLRGHGCKQCQVEGMKLTQDEYIAQAMEAHKGEYTYGNLEYVNAFVETTATCKKHGDFKIIPNHHVHKLSGCPKCSNTISSHEKQILEDFPEFEQVNRTVIHPRHLDLFSADYKLAVEVNGVYWHSEEKGKDAKYHLSKTDRCLEKGIELLHFWDYEVKTKYHIVKSMLSARLGKNERIFARKCSTKTISCMEANEFMQHNHLQSEAIHKVAIGLFYNNVLVSVMTFGKPRFNKYFEWEMIRFATRCGITVVGGASKLFSAFISDYNPKSVLSYADRRYSNGGVYSKLGFSLTRTSPPSYFYWKYNSIISRYQAQKHKLSKVLGDKFDATKTEVENMSNAGYMRVFDCGNFVYEWKNLTIV